MKRYVVRYSDGEREQEREFPTKAEAFRWFNWECPADEAFLEEIGEDGRRGVPKTMRRRGAAAEV
ncbi:MAG TPA: hypothetical protein VIK93_08375 [Limnochordales bacterium]